MTNTATRLIILIMLLQRRPNQKAADLAAELGVSVRTLHRYFAMLDEIGIPVYSERGPYGGFSLVRGYRMPPLVFTPEEAVAVYLGTSLVEEMWGRPYQEATRGALAKVENVLPDEQREEVSWARRALYATGMHRADLADLAPTLEGLRSAARERRRVRIDYQGRDRMKTSQRELDPYALVHRWGWWYVVGYCHLRQDLRIFRLDRIEGLTLLDQSFDAPQDFELRAYLRNLPQADVAITVRMHFAAEFAHVAREGRPYWNAMLPAPDGSMLVEFSAPDLTWAASTALAYGPIVEVLEPREVRQVVAEWAAAVVELYESTG